MVITAAPRRNTRYRFTCIALTETRGFTTAPRRDARAMLADLAAAVLDAVAPALCPGCTRAAGPELCERCRADLVAIERPCAACGAPSSEDAWRDRCPHCRGAGLPLIAACTVHWVYRGMVESLVRRAKAARDPAAVAACAKLCPIPAQPDQIDLVTALPPNPGRNRGPHLATALGRHCARRLGRPFRKLLRVARPAAEQHRLNQQQRQRNVEALFSCRSTAGRVLLIDDLLTTGATAVAAARSLRAAGAERVELCCLARTPQSGD